MRKSPFIWLLLFSFSSLIFIFYLYTTITINFGYFYIDTYSTTNGIYYVYIDYLNQNTKLQCSKKDYNIVRSNINSYFAIEFLQSSLSPNFGFITNIRYDEDLTNSLIFSTQE